jgi:hypothetical protein
MKNSTYQEMVIEYGNDLDVYSAERNRFLIKNSHSIILEGEFMELENLEKWISKNITLETPISIYYDKLDYNYCFVEYFFSKNKHMNEIKEVIPKIFTTYLKANPSGKIFRTNGRSENIEFNTEMLNAIVF